MAFVTVQFESVEDEDEESVDMTSTSCCLSPPPPEAPPPSRGMWLPSFIVIPISPPCQEKPPPPEIKMHKMNGKIFAQTLHICSQQHAQNNCSLS